MPNYKRTLYACNLAGFLQSATMNLSPYLFIPLSRLYGITYTQIGFLILINFVAQFAADIYFGQPVNKYGYRPFCVSSQLAIALGLMLFAAAPWLLPGNIFLVLVIATIIFSLATGLLEVILSPITKTIPAVNSEANFMLMHTSFAAGIFAASLLTTLFLYLFGIKMWQVVVFLWALLPLVNAFVFLGAPLPEITPESQRMKVGELLKNKIFILSFFAIFFGAATELLIVQWGSTYLEKGLGLSKTVGDVGGMCLFAAMLGLARYLYAKKGAGLNLNNLMIYGSLACLFCYIVVASAPAAWLVLAAFGLIGFFSSLLWTGTLIVASDSLPNTGALIFALLAGGGDLGTAAIGQAVGWFSDYFTAHAPAGAVAEQYGLKAAIALAIAVPLLSLVFQLWLKKAAPHKKVVSEIK